MRRVVHRRFLLLVLLSVPTGAGCEEAPDPCSGDRARSTCLSPAQAPEHYVEQGLRYFDTLDASADPESRPSYADRVARWEWPPWLKLTGYGRDQIAAIDRFVLGYQPGTTVPARDCRAFAVQPFGRCRVSFDYDGSPCPIYEEFTFNDQGQITFIEAWSDQPGLGPTDDPADPWAEAPGVHRLSTRIPGLGDATGFIDPEGEAMSEAARADPEVADFVARTREFWETWLDEYDAAGDDLYARGCGW